LVFTISLGKIKFLIYLIKETIRSGSIVVFQKAAGEGNLPVSKIVVTGRKCF